MNIKLGKLPFNVFLSVKRAVSSTPEIVYDVLCNVRLTRFSKRGVGRDSSAIATGTTSDTSGDRSSKLRIGCGGQEFLKLSSGQRCKQFGRAFELG